MKLSEFKRAVSAEFGVAYGQSILAHVVCDGLGDRTAQQALDEGEDPRTVWLAVCEAMDIPNERRYGVGHPERRSLNTQR